MSLSHRVHAAKVIAKRELKSTLYGTGIYITLTAIFLAASYFFVNSSVSNVLDAGVLALRNPITEPFFFSIGLAATYLGLCSALTISRERDQGTLEVLFYGPVDAVSYIASKYLHQLLAFVVVLAFATLNFFLVAQVTNFGFSSGFLWVLILSVFLTSCMVSFGILLSVSTRRMAVSVVLFLGLVLFFYGFRVAHTIVMNITGRDLPIIIVYIRMILDNLNAVVRWISPLSYFDRGMLAAYMGDTAQYLLSLLSSTVYTLILLALSVWIFKKKGVRR